MLASSPAPYGMMTVEGRRDLGAPPATAEAARATIKEFLRAYSVKEPDALLVVGETGGGQLEYDAGQRVLKVPKAAYDDLLVAFQVLGAKTPWVTHILGNYIASPLAKGDLVARLKAASATRPIHFILSTSVSSLTTARDVTGAIADFYAGLFDAPAQAQGRSWVKPVLIGGGVAVVVGTVAYLIARRRRR